ncbi:MAG: site-specific DNA-methyltransferase [candidate division WOR-3 bacterium]
MIENFIDKVICGDALDVLKQMPDNSVDLGITSPPYNKGENKRGWLVDRVIYEGATDNLPEEEYQKIQIEVLNELYRIIKPGGSFFYNHKINWLRKTKWIIRQEIIWDRMIAANIRGWRFWQVDERKNIIGEELKSKHALLTSIWRFPPEKDNPHPAPFPIELPARIIYSMMDDKKGGVIIDPYCGSGTTLVAAKILGHHFIGIDISREYVEYSIRRLENYKNEIPRVERELSKHVVRKTFKERKERGGVCRKIPKGKC